MDLTAWLRINRLGLRSRPPTSAGNTKGCRSDALAPDSTTGLMPPSPPSLTPSGTPNGPAAADYACAHRWPLLTWVSDWILAPNGRHEMRFNCQCGASVSFGEIAVPAAEAAPSSASTSAKQDSPPSAPALTFVPSGLPYTREVIRDVRDGYPVQWCCYDRVNLRLGESLLISVGMDGMAESWRGTVSQ